MDKKTRDTLNEVVEKMARSVRDEHWQAITATRGGKYPYTQNDKIRMIKSLLFGNSGF
jgi:hypothetical protein